ncbi:MAG: 4Fe-4S dicluster domain-containing protein [Desulfomonile sp.]|nr:4Fe-4S dicluster domain-containing protein [Desulfomonile sp.]
MIAKNLKQFARRCGADLVGIADVRLFHGIETEPNNLLAGFSRAVSIAVRLADGVIDPIVDRPTPLYQQHYQKVNALLDDIALRVSQRLQDSGGKALPIPASHVVNKDRWMSYISHKAVALAAGLGWQGKSLLLVSREYGPRVRLVTVLTDVPLDPDAPVRNLCGKCSSCFEACPVQAIKNVPTKYHYADRNEALHFDRCAAHVSMVNTKLPFIESPICGVCIKACPWGQRSGRSRRAKSSRR